MNKEIEKKYLIKSIEDIESFLKKIQNINFEIIEQNYVVINDKEELRIRKVIKDNQLFYYMTYKNGLGLIRDEIEFPISEDMFNELNQKANTEPIKKVRHKCMYNDYLLEIDSYTNKKYQNLIVLEVEFNNIDEIKNFENIEELKFIIQKDITEDKTYKNKNLWKTIN